MVTAEPQLHLRWHSHSATFTSMLSDLHDLAPYSDVELCCDGGQVLAHRAVLSLCSPFLANVLASLGNSSPTECFIPGAAGGCVRILLPDVPVQDMQYLVSFIYRGQVDVSQPHIASFLNTGKHLHVLGLEQGDRLVATPEASECSSSSCPASEAEEDAPSCPSRASSCASRPLSRSSTPHSQSDGGLSAASIVSSASSSLLMTLQSQQLNQAMLQQLQAAAAAGHGAKDVSDVNANLTPQKGLLGTDSNARQNATQGRAMKKEIKLKQEAMDEDKELPLNPQVFIKEERKTDREDEEEDTSLALKHSVFSNTPNGADTNNLFNNDNKNTTTTTTSDPVASAAVTSAASDTSDTSSGGTTYGEEGAPGFPNVGCIIGSDGRIDLNYYLQQAIQCASMPCPLCRKEFKSQSGLRDHIRLHTGERPFICEYCHMNFARASHLKRHRRMHTGEKPFECRICGKDFSRGDKLKDHLKRHEAEEKLTKIRKQIFTPEDCSSEAPSGLSAISSSLITAAASDSQAATGAEATPVGGVNTNDNGVGAVKTSTAATGAAAAAAATATVGGMTNSVLSVGDTLSTIGERMANLVARANPQAVTPDSVMSAKTAVATSTAATVAATLQQQIQQHQLQQMQQQQQHNLQQQAQLLQQQQLAVRQQSSEQLLRRPSLPLPNSKKRKIQHTVSSSSNNNVMASLSSSAAAATTINMITSAASRLSNTIPSASNYSNLANNLASNASSASSTSNNISSIASLMQSVANNSALSITAGGFHQLQAGGGVSSSSTNQSSSSNNDAPANITPQMLGLASIGECVLRPIN